MGVTYERECPDCGAITRNLGSHMKKHEREIKEAKRRNFLRATFNRPILPYEQRELDRQITEFATSALRRESDDCIGSIPLVAFLNCCTDGRY